MNWWLVGAILIFCVAVYYYANIVAHDGTVVKDRLKYLRRRKFQLQGEPIKYSYPLHSYDGKQNPAQSLVDRTRHYDESLLTDDDIQRAVNEVINASGARYSLEGLQSATIAMQEHVDMLRAVETAYTEVLEAERAVMNPAHEEYDNV